MDAIRFEVGEQTFVALPETLTGESQWFASAIERATMAWGPEQPIKLFVDRDPVAFRHVLRYLRTRQFPLFFDSASLVHDLVQYRILLDEARFFGIPRLVDWLEQEKYVDAIKIRHTAHAGVCTAATSVLPGIALAPLSFGQGMALDGTDTRAESSGAKVSYKLVQGVRKVYVCPRAIPVHKGHPDACGAKCNQARGGAACVFEDEPYVALVAITHKTTMVYDRQHGEDLLDQQQVDLLTMSENGDEAGNEEGGPGGLETCALDDGSELEEYIGSDSN